MKATRGFAFFGTKIKGDGRMRHEVTPWLETAAQLLKPCVVNTPAGSTIKIAFEIGVDGKARHATAEIGADAADDVTKRRIDDVVATLDIGTPAREPVTAMILLVRE